MFVFVCVRSFALFIESSTHPSPSPPSTPQDLQPKFVFVYRRLPIVTHFTLLTNFNNFIKNLGVIFCWRCCCYCAPLQTHQTLLLCFFNACFLPHYQWAKLMPMLPTESKREREYNRCWRIYTYIMNGANGIRRWKPRL